jgi:ribosomal protein S18 acetylase RimI-like enzyme
MTDLKGHLLWRLVTMKSEENTNEIYIMTLGVKKEYRNMAIASILLRSILNLYENVTLGKKKLKFEPGSH